MIMNWLLGSVDSMLRYMISTLPQWNYTLQAPGWVSAFFDWLWAYDSDFLPLHDAILPVMGLHVLFYTIVMGIRLGLVLAGLIRGGGGGA